MKPVYIALWAVAAVMPVHALLCECGTIEEGNSWSYSSGLTRRTCTEVNGKLQDQKWPSCIYKGKESTWKKKCKDQDTVGDGTRGYCSDEDSSSGLDSD
ncbi:hypothetical protein LX32DRAFT_267964 [Colletotrichum zoysiae]|uniref:Secreted protein n=1 Tax=Colletotrichum zoysiae TaxID=1216348 RepID=A0AAD9HPI7_9PEZI|nr:hypothetical protein LX32DRAFT_267964 [Colletotrichum zoysiae]